MIWDNTYLKKKWNGTNVIYFYMPDWTIWQATCWSFYILYIEIISYRDPSDVNINSIFNNLYSEVAQRLHLLVNKCDMSLFYDIDKGLISKS